MRYVLLVLLLAWTLVAWARDDDFGCAMQWPGWAIDTTEEVGAMRYPITNLCDGNPATAWVFNREKLREDDTPKDAPMPSATHGVGTRIRITTDTEHLFTLDGLGIINGYAKDRATYLRNNRITALEVILHGDGEPWRAQFPLREIMQMQQIVLPRQRVRMVELIVKGVATGKDDDLCISELALYSAGRQLSWKVSPVVIYNDGRAEGDCCCAGGPVYCIRHANGGLVSSAKKELSFVAIARQPNSACILLAAEHELYFFDLATNRVLWRQKFTGFPANNGLGWISNNTALFCSTPDPFGSEHLRWYRFSAGKGSHLQPITAPKQEPHYFPTAQGPNYGV